MRTALRILAMLLVGVWLTGCGGDKAGDKSGSKADGHDHGHDHGHGHDHSHEAHGPHGGHILELGDEEYHAEWTHDDETGKVAIYLLDGEMKNEVAIESPEIVIETKIGDTTKEYKLAAVNPTEADPPLASQFAIEDKALVVALLATNKEGAAAMLKLNIKGKDFSAKIEHHDHHH